MTLRTFVAELAAKIDHTQLKPEATVAQIETLCQEAVQFRVASVCVNSYRVQLASSILRDSSIPVCTVIGFPSGASLSEAKIAEAKEALRRGASEFDMVINIGAIKDGEDKLALEDIVALRFAIPRHNILKVIIESSVLTEDEIIRACNVAEEAGADFVKTSTGFHPSGGATLEAIRLMRSTAGKNVRIKASGGIRDAKTAIAMLEAGADRLGLSATGAVLAEIERG